jgi:hypothetical protein
MEPEGSLQWSQEPVTDPALSQLNPVHTLFISGVLYFNISFSYNLLRGHAVA